MTGAMPIQHERVSITVLMYHAVAAADEAERTGADPHYAVPAARFVEQVRAVTARGARVRSVASVIADDARDARVAFTFDDGHASNRAAAEWISMAGGSADFFVNPSTVGTAGFLDWQELRDMARAGHSIQSHGQHHRYLDELDDHGVRAELRDSKARIEDEVGMPVRLFAPPGGRLALSTAEIAFEEGYLGICGSRDGLWNPAGSTWHIPRLAVTAATGARRFERWIAQDTWEIARMRARHAVLAGAKNVLGNRRYENVRRALLGGPAPNGSPEP